MATAATLNSNHLLFENGGSEQCRIQAGAQHFRLSGASNADKVQLRNIASGSATDDAYRKIAGPPEHCRSPFSGEFGQHRTPVGPYAHPSRLDFLRLPAS